VRTVLVLVVGLAAAGAVTALRVSAHDRVTTAVTWDGEIAPIVAAHCAACHSGQAGTPVSLATYEAARPWARAIRQQVITRRMPIWRAARGYGEFANDPSLSPFEISLIVAWADGGAPKNTPAKSPAPIVAAEPAMALIAPPSRVREATIACGGHVTQTGLLVGLRLRLSTGGSLRVMAAWPNGERRILGWFRDGDPADETTYWLRTPIDLRAGVSLASSPSSQACSLALMLR
jgi:hypothetical protein